MISTSNPDTLAKNNIRRANTLASGCILNEYLIDCVLGAGGFGVTYKAWDTLLETWVALKEYFPLGWSFRDGDGVTVYPNTQGGSRAIDDNLSNYLWGLERFLEEARVLARVQHPYVVRVKRYFRAHGTAYIVMDYEEGQPLSAVLGEGETLDEAGVRGLLEDVLPALRTVHEQGFLHRDIKPSNLYIRAHDHRVILIDFGAAREAVSQQGRSMTSLVTPGYSPPEQYTTRSERYGAWTDLYALGAVLYRCVTGRAPLEAAERLLEDRLEPAAQVAAGRYSASLLEAIDRTLAVQPEQRFPTVTDFQAALDEDGDETVILGSLVGAGRKSGQQPKQSRTIEPVSTPIIDAFTGGDGLKFLPPLDRGEQPPNHRLKMLQPPDSFSVRRPSSLSNLVVGGSVLALALVALGLVWLWSSWSVSEESLSRDHALSSRTQPSQIPDSSPPSGGSSIVVQAPSVVQGSTVSEQAAKTAPVTPPATSAPEAATAQAIPGPSPLTAESTAPLPTAPPLAPAEVSDPARVPKSGAAMSPPLALPDQGSDPQVAGPMPTALPDPPAYPAVATEAAAKPSPEPTAVTGSPKPVETPTAGRPSEPGGGTAGEFLTPATPGAVPAIKAGTGSPAKLPVKTSSANKASARSTAAPTQPRNPRRSAGRKRDVAQLGYGRDEPPIKEKPVGGASVSSPWGSPDSTGFNQK